MQSENFRPISNNFVLQGFSTHEAVRISSVKFEPLRSFDDLGSISSVIAACDCVNFELCRCVHSDSVLQCQCVYVYQQCATVPFRCCHHCFAVGMVISGNII